MNWCFHAIFAFLVFDWEFARFPNFCFIFANFPKMPKDNGLVSLFAPFSFVAKS